MEITAISEVSNALSLGNTNLITPPESSFMDVALAKFDSINMSLIEADNTAQKLAMGENIPSHEVMIAMEKARLELNLAVQVRNKLLDAYQEITKMQI